MVSRIVFLVNVAFDFYKIRYASCAVRMVEQPISSFFEKLHGVSFIRCFFAVVVELATNFELLSGREHSLLICFNFTKTTLVATSASGLQQPDYIAYA